RALSTVRQPEPAWSCVISDRGVKFRNQGGTFFFEQIVRNKRTDDGGAIAAGDIAVECDVYVFQSVPDAADQVVNTQRARQAGVNTGAPFVVKILHALKVVVVVVQVHTQLQFPPEQPWFDEGQLIILKFSAQPQTQQEFLAAAGKVRRM